MAIQWPMMMNGEDLVGLDIGERSVAAVQLRSRPKGQWEVRNAGVMELALGAADRDVAHALHTLWRQNRMVCTSVCSCLRSPSLLVRHFKAPSLTDDEIHSAFRLAAEEALQMPADQFYLDWHLFGRTGVPAPRAKEDPTEGFFVAVPNKEAQRHLDLLEAAGLHAIILDVGCTAIANLYLMCHGPTQVGAATCLMNLQDHCIDLAILNGNNFLYPRSIYLPTETWAQALDKLVENIRHELKYFEFKLFQHPVKKMVLMGPAALDRQLTEHLQETLALPVEHWNPLQDPHFEITHAARAVWQDAALSPHLVASLGLALRTG